MEKYLTPKQLSERWQGLITVKTLAAWRSQKKGPIYVKIGGRAAYPISSVEEYEQKREVRPAGK